MLQPTLPPSTLTHTHHSQRFACSKIECNCLPNKDRAILLVLVGNVWEGRCKTLREIYIFHVSYSPSSPLVYFLQVACQGCRWLSLFSSFVLETLKTFVKYIHYDQMTFTIKCHDDSIKMNMLCTREAEALSWIELGFSWIELGFSWIELGFSWIELGFSWIELGFSWIELGFQNLQL